jgi:23S rRNA pseudouridine1911/1915/1917 synthase
MLQRLSGQRALLQVNLQTGRKHQIRLQLAHRGWSIIGDWKYGSGAAFPAGIALHARRLAFDHPTRKEHLTFSARLPATWQSVGLNEDVAVKLESDTLQ